MIETTNDEENNTWMNACMNKCMHGCATRVTKGYINITNTADCLQDLAVVVLLMLIPLLAPSDSGALGLSKIAKALGLAAVKAVVAIVTIILGGRTLLRPLYRRIAALENTEIFAATTLLVVLGTSVMTQIAGLSLALGAFLVSNFLVVLTDNL